MNGIVSRTPAAIAGETQASVLISEGTLSMRESERNRANARRILEWVAEGKLKPHVHGVSKFADAQAALERMERREVMGKLVLVP